MRRQQEAAQGAGKVSDTESDKAVEDSLFWEGPVEQKSDSQRASDPEKSQGQLQRETRQGKGYGMRPLSQMASTLQRSTNWRAGWGGGGVYGGIACQLLDALLLHRARELHSRTLNCEKAS